MPFRLVALDVDGTLLNDDHELSDRTIQTLRQVNDAGVNIVLCTGRGPGNAIPVLEQLGLEGVLLTHNGASTVQSPGPRVLHEFSFNAQVLTPVIAYCRANAVHFDVSTSFDLYIEKAEDAIVAIYERFLISPVLIGDVLALEGQILKLSMFGPSDQMDQVERDLAAMELPGEFYTVRSSPEYIDVLLTDSSKGSALRELAASWGIDREHILAIGNYYNDVDMLQFAGLGIAMDNSPDDVKAAADEVTLSNNEDGVAEALLKHVLRPLTAE